MSLLDDLKSLNVSGIVEARSVISAVIGNDDLQAILKGGAVEAALGPFGEVLAKLKSQNPAQLLQPLAEGFDDLIGSFDLSNLPLVEYLDAVREGAAIIARFLEGIDDPSQLGKGFGFSLGEALSQAQRLVEGYTEVGADELARFTQLVQRVERGVPLEPDAFAALALDVLLPFSREPLVQVRRTITELLEGALAIELPLTRSQGLLLALEAVRVAAETGEVARLEAALNNLATVRAATLSSIREDLFEVFRRVGGLQVQRALEVVARIADTLPTGEPGVLEYLLDLETIILAARGNVENLDPQPLLDILANRLTELETLLRSMLVDPIDAVVNQLETRLRDFFAQLPLRALRARLSSYIHDLALVVQDADLGQYARAARTELHELLSFAAAPDLASGIAEQLQSIKETIAAALDEIDGALQTVATTVNDLAGEAQGILERAADALDGFADAIENIKGEFDLSIIDEAAQQVIDTVRELREKAEELLSELPIPEPLRVLVDQLIAQVEGLDLEKLIAGPVKDTTARLTLPADIQVTITDALTQATKVVTNLIPTKLIADIQAEVQAAFDAIASFNPTSLLGGVTAKINEIASSIEELTLPPAVLDPLRAPYLAVVKVLDSAKPSQLLAPVIDAYQELLGNIPVPSPESGTRQVMGHLEVANEQMARNMTGPVTRFVPGAKQVSEPTETVEPPPDDLRLGDIVRIIGYLPDKLRSALAGLNQTKAGEILRAIDALCGRLARDLRTVEATIWSIDARMNDNLHTLFAPLGEAQFKAQLAIQTNFSSNGANLDVEASLDLLAEVSPGAMLNALTGEIEQARHSTRRAATGAAESAGVAMERLASALERCRLARLGEDLEAFLSALDPNPIAEALDTFGLAIRAKVPTFMNEHGEELLAAAGRVRDLFRAVNPGAQIQKFLRLLEVLRDEIDLLNPRRLAAELDEIHGVLVEALAEFDPALFVAELQTLLQPIADTLRSLDPAALLGDLTPFNELLERARAANPAVVLEGIGAGLAEVGERFEQLNPASLLDLTATLKTKIDETFEKALEAIRQEVIALLKSLKFASGSASASAEVEIG